MTVAPMSTLDSIQRYTRRTHIIPASLPQHGDVSVRRELDGPLRLSVHDYSVLGSNKDGLTVILTHGTSFNKNFWELVIHYLLCQKDLRTEVRRLIAIDAANHGDSAVLNREVLPSKACWADDSRDILHTLRFLAVDGPALGIGHSFGGGSMSHAHMMDPGAFLATILVEPILFQMKSQTEAVARMTLGRRDTWDSQSAVATAFERSKSLQDWDRRQLKVYIEHGTFSTGAEGESKRTLKTPKEQEVATYLAAPHPQILELLSESTGRHHFIWGSESKVVSSNDRRSVERIIQPPSTSQVIAGAGHLIPMTHPEQLSIILGNLIVDICSFPPQVKL
ncbi:Alpha/beta hydrolase family-domain-containing protein [Thelonectria olida]|uniref:Alpha/beta hydrolase family-domain-containing protein n=1 Tax=Thelonectria olida TaxID=1576542 RepID=A0A9P8W2E3_9HYPO|nr:Alpha/beta hydrolase family-domain-containing protein [Thelonectria olida]